MAKKVPKYILQNLEKTSSYMEKVVRLNQELEEWLEKNGIQDGFDLTSDYRESRGYEIFDTESFLDRALSEMNANEE